MSYLKSFFCGRVYDQQGAKTKTFGYHTCGEVKYKPKCCEHVRLCLTQYSKRLSGNTQVLVRTHELAL